MKMIRNVQIFLWKWVYAVHIFIMWHTCTLQTLAITSHYKNASRVARYFYCQMWWPQKNMHVCPTHISSKWQNPLPKVWSTSWWYVSEGYHFYEKPGWADWNYQLLTFIACSWVAQILSVFIIGHEPMLVMAALRSRCGHYIFALWFLSIYLLSFFYSSPNLSGRTLDIYHTSTQGVTLVRI